jgi:CelD/BcsL family acetyltransferase involved in cellulose biosynthesis
MLTRTIWRSPYLDVAGDLTAYEASRRRGALADLRRRRRRMSDQGNVSVEEADGSERLDVLLREAFDIEAMGWKGARGTAIRSHAETRRFYTEVAAGAADKGWFRLHFLRLNGQSVAFSLSLEYDGVLYLLKGGFDPDFARFAPSRQLLYELIRRAFATGLRRIDFGGADEPYKMVWTDATRERGETQAFAPGPAGRLAWIGHGRLLPLARRTHLTRVIGTGRAELRQRLKRTGRR